VETRPDWCGEAEIERMLDFGTTRVELGVQTLDDEVYRLVKRGHTVSDVVEATGRLKDAGLKVHYHWMPGLPGMIPEKDLELAERLFDDDRFRPDGLKLYPTMVVGGTELEEWWRQGRYQPYPDDTMVGLILDIKKKVPSYVRISRVLRDIPAKFIVAGLKDSLRESVQERLAEEKNGCRCVRCREYGRRLRQGCKIGEPQLKRYDYQASGGREIFLSFEDSEETLFGLLRLRIQDSPPFRLKEMGKVVLVRELHIYGPEVSLGERLEAAAQHRGLGRELLKEAERIAGEEFGTSSVAVLSGVGAREYYAGQGYHRQNGYMIK
jgi:elongator complex protein 3